MNLQQVLTSIPLAFFRQDYRQVLVLAQRLPFLPHQLLQMVIISSQRLGAPVQEVATALAQESKLTTWERQLLDLTLGRIPFQDLLPDAKTAEQRCQLFCFEGSRLLTAGRIDEARINFVQSLALGSNSLDYILAFHQMRFEMPAKDLDALRERLGQLVHRIEDRFAHGSYPEALRIAKRVNELADRFMERTDIERLCCVHILAMAYHYSGDDTSAKIFCEAALIDRKKHHGTDNYDYTTSLNLYASIEINQGRELEALSLFREAISIRRRVLGKAALQTGKGWYNLAHTYERCNLGRCALHSYTIALKLFIAIGGRDQAEEIIWSVSRAIDLCLKFHRCDSASTQFQLFKEWASEEDLARLLNSTAQEILASKSVGDEANSNVECILSRIEQLKPVFGEVLPALQARLDEVGKSNLESGRFEIASQFYEKAAEIYRTGGDRYRNLYGYSLYANSIAKRKLGCDSDAISLLQEGIQVKEQLEKPEEVALCCRSLAQIYQSRREYEKALPLLQKASRLYSIALGEGETLALIAYETGYVYLQLRLFKPAASVLHNSVQMLRDHRGDRPRSLVNALYLLGVAFHGIGNYQDAQRVLRECLSLHSNLDQGESLGRARASQALAMIALDVEDAEGSKEILSQTESTLVELFGEESEEYRSFSMNLAALHYENGEYGKADASFSKALGDRANLPSMSDAHLAISLELWAATQAALGRFEDALSISLEVSSLQNNNMEVVFSVGSEVQKEEYIRELTESLHLMLSLASCDVGATRDRVHDLWDVVIQRRSLRLAGARSIARPSVAGTTRDVLDVYDELVAVRSALADMTLEGIPKMDDSEANGYAASKAYVERILELQYSKRTLEARLTQAHPALSIAQQALRIGSREAGGSLPPGATLIEFVCYDSSRFTFESGEASHPPDQSYAVFVLGAHVEARIVFLGDAAELDEAAGDYLQCLSSPPSAGVVQDNLERMDCARKLREKLWKPLGINPGSEHLFVVLDGQLNRLPLELLPNNGRGLIRDDHLVSYLQSSRDLIGFGEDVRDSSGPVIVGDPDFLLATKADDEVQDPVVDEVDSTTLLRFDRLPGSRIEAESVSDILCCPIWLGDSVLKKRLKDVASPRILHIATHGYALDYTGYESVSRSEMQMFVAASDMGEGRLAGLRLQDPFLRSGLAVAGAQSWLQYRELPANAGNGLLTAEDVSQMDLAGTELVVLSACETGLGEIRSGEGAVGLRYAFQVAGARCLVVSLWRVSDISTAILMERFYANLVYRKKGRTESMRLAQEYVRDLTVGSIRKSWLSGERIATLRAENEAIGDYLDRLCSSPDSEQPFQHPAFWGGFVCIGDPGKLSHAII